MINFDRIVAYGCSMTAADEALDHIFVDKLTEYEVDKTKIDMGVDWCPDWPKKYFTPEYCSDSSLFDEDGKWIYMEGQRRAKEVSWVRRLADMFDVPWVNNAMGGAGNEHSICCYEEDLARGNLRDTDLILFGITSPQRWFWYNDWGHKRHPLYAFSTEAWPSKRLYEEYIAHLAHDFQIYWDFFYQLKYIDMLSKTTNGRVRSLFVTQRYDDIFLHMQDPRRFTDTQHPLWNSLQTIPHMQSIIKTDFFFKSYTHYNRKSTEPTPNYCGFGHPKESEHRLLASSLYETLINE